MIISHEKLLGPLLNQYLLTCSYQKAMLVLPFRTCSKIIGKMSDLPPLIFYGFQNQGGVS